MEDVGDSMREATEQNGPNDSSEEQARLNSPISVGSMVRLVKSEYLVNFQKYHNSGY